MYSAAKTNPSLHSPWYFLVVASVADLRSRTRQRIVPKRTAHVKKVLHEEGRGRNNQLPIFSLAPCRIFSYGVVSNVGTPGGKLQCVAPSLDGPKRVPQWMSNKTHKTGKECRSTDLFQYSTAWVLFRRIVTSPSEWRVGKIRVGTTWPRWLLSEVGNFRVRMQ
jgi:hypothetical protein